nr:Uncharacterized protein YtfN [Salmonella sp. NCTC 7297]
MSLWKKISLGVLIFIVALLASVAFLVGTTTGLHLVFSAANRWVPGLEIGQVTGGWRDLSLKNIRYEQPGVAVNAGEVHLAVGLGCLWRSSLCINDLALKDINVAVDQQKNAAFRTGARRGRKRTAEPLHALAYHAVARGAE